MSLDVGGIVTFKREYRSVVRLYLLYNVLFSYHYIYLHYSISQIYVCYR